MSLSQPQKAGETQRFAEPPLQARSVQAVAVGIEQAFGGGQQRASTVGFDAAAFQNQIDRLARGGAKRARFVQPGGDPVVEFEGVLFAPAVETEIQQHRLAVAVNGDRAVVARPDVVGRHRVQPTPGEIRVGGAQQVADMLAMLEIVAADQDGLAVADRGGQRGERPIGLAQPGSPVAVGVRPSEQDGVLTRPFGG